jgi:hypothetical protein
MPLEIDIHFKCYTFEPWDVEYDLLGILRLVQFQNGRIQILCLWWFCRLASFSCPWRGCLKYASHAAGTHRGYEQTSRILCSWRQTKKVSAICLLLDSYLSYSLTLIHKRPCRPMVNHVIMTWLLN